MDFHSDLSLSGNPFTIDLDTWQVIYVPTSYTFQNQPLEIVTIHTHLWQHGYTHFIEQTTTPPYEWKLLYFRDSIVSNDAALKIWLIFRNWNGQVTPGYTPVLKFDQWKRKGSWASVCHKKAWLIFYIEVHELKPTLTTLTFIFLSWYLNFVFYCYLNFYDWLIRRTDCI